MLFTVIKLINGDLLPLIFKMGSQPSTIHTPACQEWLDNVYHQTDDTEEMNQIHCNLMKKIKEEQSQLTTNIQELGEFYKDFKFPDEIEESDLDYYRTKYREDIEDYYCSMQSNHEKFSLEKIEKETLRYIYKEFKQNAGFKMLDIGIAQKMLDKIIAVERLPLLELREKYKQNLGKFPDIVIPLIEKYQLERFPEALSFWGQGNLHRL